MKETRVNVSHDPVELGLSGEVLAFARTEVVIGSKGSIQRLREEEERLPRNRVAAEIDRFN